MWRRCWATARVILHLTDDEFFRMTPRNYHALYDMAEQQVRRSEAMFAQLNATVANYSMRASKKALSYKDFLPRYGDEEEPQKTQPKRRKRVNQKALAADFRMIMEGFRGMPPPNKLQPQLTGK